MPVVQYPTNILEILGSDSSIARNMVKQQIADAQIGEHLNQQSALQDYLFKQQKNPLDIEAQRLANVGTGYTNDKLGVDARTAQALEESNIQKGKATNAADTQAAQVKQISSFAEMAGQLADMVENGMPVVGLAGKVPDQIYQMLAQPNGPKALRQFAQQIATNSAEQLRKMQERQYIEQQANARTRDTNQTNWDIANLRRSTSLELAAKKASQSVSDKNWQQASIRYDMLADLADAEGDVEAAQAYRAKSAHYAGMVLQKPTDTNKINTPGLTKLPANPTPNPVPPPAKPSKVPSVMQLPGGVTVRIKESKG